MFYKIALITLAFHNQTIIKYLRQRGEFIKNEKWQNARIIEKEIDKEIKNKIKLNKF